MHVSLLSIDGKEVSIGIHNQSITQMTLITNRAAPGLYILSIQDESRLFQSKVIIAQ